MRKEVKGAAPTAPVQRRRGRPRADNHQNLDAAVLDVATQIFLELGFGRTTIDRVAEVSGVGKSTIYRRYPNKHELFSAVVLNSIDVMFKGIEGASERKRASDRLRSVGYALIESLLIPRCVAFMRITAAETATFPTLAEQAYKVSYDGAVAYAARAIAGSTDDTQVKQAMAIAGLFVKTAVQPIAFQALYEPHPDRLLPAAAEQIEAAVSSLLARKLIAS